jgi:Tol biopolymer transport system component
VDEYPSQRKGSIGAEVWFVEYVHRRAYWVLLVAGMLGLVAWVMGDAGQMVERAWAGAPAGAAPVAATGESGAAAVPAGATQLTKAQAMDGFGVWSPDGRRVAFMRDGKIWLMGADGQGASALTRAEGSWDAAPAWRPGGKELAFSRVNTEGDGASVMIIDAATGKERQLSRETEVVGHVAWDASGKVLFYITPQRLMKVDARTGRGQEVHSLPDGWDMQAGGLTISPNGKKAIIGAGPRVGRTFQYDLFEIDLTAPGAERKQLTHEGGIMPMFDPSGKWLAYRSPRGESSGIHVMDYAKHTTRQVVADEARALYFHPAWSPDGKRLLVSRLLIGSSGGGPDGNRFTSHLLVVEVGR